MHLVSEKDVLTAYHLCLRGPHTRPLQACALMRVYMDHKTFQTWDRLCIRKQHSVSRESMNSGVGLHLGVSPGFPIVYAPQPASHA